MAPALTLLDGVRWDGTPVTGERSRSLLAALASGEGRSVRPDRLVRLIWGEDPPANTGKALQVVVSRTRAACGTGSVVHDDTGYRLGIGPEAVDVLLLRSLAARAAATLDADPTEAADLAGRAVDLAHGPGLPGPARDARAPEPGGSVGPSGTAGGDGGGDVRDDDPLAGLLREAAADAARARIVLARASARTGRHAEALPALEAAHASARDDEALLADLLRSEAAVRGPGAALERYETYRRDLRERLGANPGDALRRAHRDLLAADGPVRAGVRHDATELLGRDGDVRRLRALLSSSRVVSILGPGGLGKTRLAHVLARDAEQPMVHVVELVGVTSPGDVVGELGSALGVRDSVAGRRALTPEQRADVRSRIAEHLDRAPALLVLDNCEHVIGAVASLVAFLVSATADLRVLTTTRAPLAIAAERVHLLGALGPDDARRLFRERATAARPGVRLEEDAVDTVVDRLDGLPLAIELAAARVRAMSVEDVARRLADRFALLRGGDRTAPDRHRTLEAVIGWSWDLLDDPGRAALRRLSVFHDGFALDAADEVLGIDALPAVQDLVAQSLLTVEETDDGVRHRMLETVREFGRLRLQEAGEDDEARAAHRAWAVGYASLHRPRLFGPAQFDVIDRLAAEDGNLADALRAALDDADADAAITIVAALAGLWTIRGDHGRVLVLAAPLAAVVAGWTPVPELVDAARAAAAITVTNALIAADERTVELRELLARIQDVPGGDAQIAATARAALAYDPETPRALPKALEALVDDPDRHLARTALQWTAHARENAGDVAGAVRAAERALVLTDPEADGPWAGAVLRTQLAQLTGSLGDHAGAERHARGALPVLERLGARDDLSQLRALMALGAVADGRFGDAEEQFAAIDRLGAIEAIFGGRAARAMAEAELLLARGDRDAGLTAYRSAIVAMTDVTFPGMPSTGFEPWLLYAESSGVAAFARHAGPDEQEEGRALARSVRDRTVRALRSRDAYLDHPVTGLGLYAVAAWDLFREDQDPEPSVRLLVLAERFSYNRWVPSMAWAPAAERAEARAPGRLGALRTALAGVSGDALERAALDALGTGPQTRLE
ncbi:BTAD domain-containing putative transcriptional regulator [Patulibacter sp.]|uniref:BTAD domain-containing putative transcriptional regulator n=1 Tax=Patulibacter sp. TaxID=1912859 RepID=UPI002723426D|nr:BTAD domain-containing putative transcriptional regulator [Patulibacter sp.]MDO9409488.1 BTAD domain-containing putative transcriptional regulator [Patulibacter sp.]